MNNSSEEQINQRREANKKRYDELTIRQNLLLSVYPNLEEAPETIKKELEEIVSIKLYLKDGVISGIYGPVKIDEVYIDNFQKKKYEEATKWLHEFQKENEKYITKQHEAEFKMPSYNIDKYLEQVRNASDKPGEVVAPSEEIRRIIWLCNYDQSREFERKLKEAREEWAERLQKEKEEKRVQQNVENEQRRQAIRKATERYEKLSLFGKIKANISGQGLSHISDFSTDEINSMYRDRKKKQQVGKTTQEITPEIQSFSGLEKMSELNNEPEKADQDKQSAKEQWDNSPSQQSYYNYRNEIEKRLEKEKNEEEKEKNDSKEDTIQDIQVSEEPVDISADKKSPMTEYEEAKESFDEKSQEAQLLQQEKSSKEIGEDLEEFESRERRILNSKHFTDEQKKKMIEELYSEFDEYTEQNSELSCKHM